MNPASILAFFIKNWKFVAGIALVIGLIFAYNSLTDHYYELGKEAGIDEQFEKCKKDTEKLVEAHNKQVDDLETTVKTLGDKLTTSNTENAAKVKKLMEELNRRRAEIDRNVYTADGSKVKCLPEGAELHLGSEFSLEWNQLNAEGQTK